MYEELLAELTAMNGNAQALLEKYNNAGVKLDDKTNELLQLIADAGTSGLEAINTLLANGNVAQADNALKFAGKDLIDFVLKTGNNQITSWARISNGAGTPIIEDGFNISSLVRNSTGNYGYSFLSDMDNDKYSVSILGGRPDAVINTGMAYLSSSDTAVDKFTFQMVDNAFKSGTESSQVVNTPDLYIIVVGGKN